MSDPSSRTFSNYLEPGPFFGGARPGLTGTRAQAPWAAARSFSDRVVRERVAG